MRRIPSYPKYFLTILFIFFFQKSIAQESITPDPFVSKILTQADTLMHALGSSDGLKAIPFIHSDYFNKIQSKEKFLFAMDAAKAQNALNPVTMEFKIKIPTQMVTSDGVYYAVCNFEQEINAGVTTTNGTGSVIAISSDNGKTWFFVPIMDEEDETLEYIDEMNGIGLKIDKPNPGKY